MTPPTILDVMTNALGHVFAGHSWQPWRVALSVLFGLGVPADGLELFRGCTGRTASPKRPYGAAWFLCGRRSGKSLVGALAALYCACFRRYALQPGEYGVVMLLAADRMQARVLMRYVKGLIHAVPMLAEQIVNETQESLELKGRIVIEVHTSSYRRVRGRTCVACICDEICFWSTDQNSADPDVEVLNAVRPSMATIENGVLMIFSSVYARRGEGWLAYERFYGRDDAAELLWVAPTWVMNPLLSRESDVIERAYATDESSAAAEYGSEWRRDIELLLTREAVEAVIVPGRLELAPLPDVQYFGFVDPSGGSADSMTLAIGHTAEGRHMLDLLREVIPPFSPAHVVSQFADVCHQYGVTELVGDRWGGEFAREPFRERGIQYTLAELTASDLLRSVLPIIHSTSCELLDVPRLRSQLVRLERRTSRTGKDSVAGPPNGHDDLAVAVAGLMHELARRAVRSSFRIVNIWTGEDVVPDRRALVPLDILNQRGRGY